jgi:hypothetical protein
MAIELNINTVIAKAKAKVALLEGLQKKQEELNAEYAKKRDAITDARTAAYNKWALDIIKQAIKKPSSAKSVRIDSNYRGVAISFDLPKGSVATDGPDLDALFPYPERENVVFPKAFDRRGYTVSVEQTIHDLKNSIEWLSCIEPDTKFSVSEFNRITASL